MGEKEQRHSAALVRSSAQTIAVFALRVGRKDG
jgi:hypothetical protein